MQIAGCTSETLATFRQFQADGGFAIPTQDLGQVNPLLDANCTGLLLYENESQMLHGLWKSTRIAESGAEVRSAQSGSNCPPGPLTPCNVKEIWRRVILKGTLSCALTLAIPSPGMAATWLPVMQRTEYSGQHFTDPGPVIPGASVQHKSSLQKCMVNTDVHACRGS